MRARLIALDDRVNWAGVAGALCLYDILAAQCGWRSASRWMRSHPTVALAFVLAIANHLYPYPERTS